MSHVLIYDDTLHSPELRREVPVSIEDPFLYAEVDGERHVVVPRMEIPLLEDLEVQLETHPLEELGSDELYQEGLDSDTVMGRVAARFCERYGLKQAMVPGSFPIQLADTLRAAGVSLTPHQQLFADRRRVKTPSQLAGIRRAQQAATAGMSKVAELIRRAVPQNGETVVDGEPLTSERLRRTLFLTFLDNDATSDEAIVSHGPQSAIGHEMGTGPILPGEPIVVDIWPQDTISACHTDMSRTFVVGQPPTELVEYQRVVKRALEAAVAELRPGVTGRAVFDQACDVIEAAGYPTGRTKEPGKPLDHGFYHGLGHGVGLKLHEAPMLGLNTQQELTPGDVITIEPGIYRPGFGGCRLEDILLITHDGAERLTDFPYDLAP